MKIRMWTVLWTTIRKARNHCQDVDQYQSFSVKGRSQNFMKMSQVCCLGSLGKYLDYYLFIYIYIYIYLLSMWSGIRTFLENLGSDRFQEVKQRMCQETPISKF